MQSALNLSYEAFPSHYHMQECPLIRVIDVLPEDQILNNTLFLRTIDIEEEEEEARASIHRGPNIYQALPSVAPY